MMERLEYNGIANCASDFASGVNSLRIVFAKPIFAKKALSSEQLPLEAIYNHPDYVDLISAQELNIEHLTENGILICILVTATEAALDEVERIICGRVCGKRLSAVSHLDENEIHVQMGEKAFTFQCDDSLSADGECIAKAEMPAAAAIAALTQWCEDYPVHLYWPDEQ